MRQPESGIAYSFDEAKTIAGEIGTPCSFVPATYSAAVGWKSASMKRRWPRYMRNAVDVSELANAPVLIDRFLSEAVEVDVDVVADYSTHADTASSQLTIDTDPPRAVVCGVMEHIEEAGVHSGDSSCTIPPRSLPASILREIESTAMKLAERLKVRGLMNVQMAVKDETIYMIEVNPRASRTVPYVAKAMGVPWARIAAKVMMGRSLDSLEVQSRPATGFHAVKEPIFPFEKFPGVDVVLGPEMRSTGEVMGIDRSLSIALAKAKMAVGQSLPTAGDVFLSVRDSDKEERDRGRTRAGVHGIHRSHHARDPRTATQPQRRNHAHSEDLRGSPSEHPGQVGQW